jgi:hypothetical protein
MNDVRPLIVYHYANEEILTEQFLHLMIVLLSISIFYRFYKTGSAEYKLKDIFLIPVILCLILVFLIPGEGYAGMMSDRLSLMLFMNLIVFIFLMDLPVRVSYIAIPVILILHFSLLAYHFNAALRKLNRDAIRIYQTSEKIPEKSIVLPVNMSENWLQIHFSNYLGTDRDLVILENYEASVGWFPVAWNRDQIPEILLGEMRDISGIHWPGNKNTPEKRQIDYIFLYGQTGKINESGWQELRRVVEADFTIAYFTDDGYIRLYRRKLPD